MENIPIVIGIGLVLAFVASKVFKRFGVPQVVGFMAAGILLRILGIITPEYIDTLGVIFTLALGLIGYNIGLELKTSILRGRIRRILLIVVLEATSAFWIVALLVFSVTQQMYVALILGSIASATAPAATADVIWDHECKGPVTESLMFVLAMDDIIAVVLTNAVIAFALFHLTAATNGLFSVIISPLIMTGGSILVGVIFGIVFTQFVKIEEEKGVIVELELALVILLVGVVDYLAFNDILAAIAFGVIVGNGVPQEKQQGPQMLEVIMAPIVMLFFVLAGAKTNLSVFMGGLGGTVIILTILYIGGRTFGKVVGARIGGILTSSEPTVKKYLGICLLSQAGVALGLSVIIESEFSVLGGEAALFGSIILSVVAISTMFLEIVGPIAAKWGLAKAGEVGNGRADCIEPIPAKSSEVIETSKEIES
ncbi:MAG: cation:proton antiporter [Candidatus Thorarchaeota archaeon]|nr:MAG: cation:proton antiporter [Candidatus Thorarchaeota archaeon]